MEPIDYGEHTGVVGIPEDTQYLAQRIDEVAALLGKMLVSDVPVQIPLDVAAAAAVSSVWNTHVRVAITNVVLFDDLANLSDLIVGSAKFIRGLLKTGGYPCYFVVEPGVDIQVASQGGAQLYAAAHTIVLLGRNITE